MNATSEARAMNLPASKGVPFSGLFILSSSAILAITGLAKAWSALSHTKLLAVADPITGMSFGHLMLAVGVLEFVIASICIFGKSQKLKLGLIAWLATNFVVDVTQLFRAV